MRAFGLLSLATADCRAWQAACSLLELSSVDGGGKGQTHLGRWRSNDFVRPVLKHGPRSLTRVQVLE